MQLPVHMCMICMNCMNVMIEFCIINLNIMYMWCMYIIINQDYRKNFSCKRDRQINKKKKKKKNVQTCKMSKFIGCSLHIQKQTYNSKCYECLWDAAVIWLQSVIMIYREIAPLVLYDLYFTYIKIEVTSL